MGAPIKLRDGSLTNHANMDRITLFDERSREYSVNLLQAQHGYKDAKSIIWDVPTQLDQGQDGACVAFGISHMLNAIGAKAVCNQDAKILYWAIQLTDPWPGGDYPGAEKRYSGTAVLSGMKAIKDLGFIQNFYWAFKFEEILKGLQHSPGVMGGTWRQSMTEPGPDGFITYDKTSLEIGGHCTCLIGVNIKYGFVIIKNSWGKLWGANGCCYMTFADFMEFLKNGGEVSFVKF